MVRENQVIIRLPDPERMQVKAKINEAKIALVETDMPVTIRMDAFPDVELEGVVEKVNEYPAPTSWYSGNIKEYETFVKILGSPTTLKPGLTAEVRIQVEQLSRRAASTRPSRLRARRAALLRDARRQGLEGPAGHDRFDQRQIRRHPRGPRAGPKDRPRGVRLPRRRRAARVEGRDRGQTAPIPNADPPATPKNAARRSPAARRKRRNAAASHPAREPSHDPRRSDRKPLESLRHGRRKPSTRCAASASKCPRAISSPSWARPARARAPC